MTTAERALQLLRRALDESATFRDGQLEAIEELVDRRGRVLVVQRTGWGKSVVYFLATALLREAGAGPTLLISPLLSLMRDQIRLATRLGVSARTINSTNPQDWKTIEAALAADEIDLLLVSPERLANEGFVRQTLPSIATGIGLFVVDEAHCISDWGHDFRLDYQRINRIAAQLPKAVPVLATTATANDRVVADIAAQLGPDLTVLRGSLGRDSLCVQVVVLPSQAERLAWLAQYLTQAEGSGIVYTLTVADAQRVSAWLAEQGIDAPAYYAAVPHEERVELEERLRRNELKALVATVALGMGFDKPDLAFVVHFQRPASVVAYYQQIGRAGRAVDRAEAVLLAGAEDDQIADAFREGAFPAEEELQQVVDALEDVDDAGVAQLEQGVNLSHGEIERALRVLELEGAAARDGSRWARTPNAWVHDRDRVSHVTATRVHEQDRMRAYVGTSGCLMKFLTDELDDPASAPCGRCANCAGPFAPETAERDLATQALHFLRRTYRPIVPRRRWPVGVASPTTISEVFQEGRALSLYGDPGWGQLVKEGKYGDDGFDDELVEAVADMLDDWQPDPRPTWVTAVPSLRDPDRVPSFARRLAERLGVPYRDALVKTRDTPPQKQMQNSFQQATNALGAFAAVPEQVLDGPVLLVDDMVDSRWSMTVCGVELLEAGSGPVFPMALAQTTRGSS
ncbi:MAG: RecQ family ATP-dependent DNA helicase [Solirubrobacteraceae bacterium]